MGRTVMLTRIFPWHGPPPAIGCPRTAVVLVHGYFCTSRALYWQGLQPLRAELLVAGHPVIRSCQPRTGSIAFRAQHLARFLDRLPYHRLILIGHSMGGLDARYVASRLDPQRRIAHVITIGTPHQGTAAADWALRQPLLATRLLRFIDRGALRDLTVEHAERVNAEMPDREDVGYVSLGGVCATEKLVGTLRRLGEQVSESEGPNDGMVALSSALRSGSDVTLGANHLELIGQRLLNGHRVQDPIRLAGAVSALRSVLQPLLQVTGAGSPGAG